MDNLSMDVRSQGRESLAYALQLIWPNAAGGKATHYKIIKATRKLTYFTHELRNGLAPNVDLHQENPKQIRVSHYEEEVESTDGTQTLVLLWHDERDATKLPYPLTLDKAITFAADWLTEADYGSEPDHDGDNQRGWRAFTDGWGHVVGHHCGIIGIQPAWAMYGK